MSKPITIFVAGAITIGIITALTMNGRKSVELTKTGFDGASKLLGTAISGK